MGPELLTNKELTRERKVDITSPAFSGTKIVSVTGAIAAVAAVVLTVVPDELRKHPGVVVASIAAGTLVALGIFLLVAVDIRTRQRAQEAKRRWPLAGDSEAAGDASGGQVDTLSIQVNSGGDSDYRRLPAPAAPESSSARVIKLEPGQDVSLVISNSKT